MKKIIALFYCALLYCIPTQAGGSLKTYSTPLALAAGSFVLPTAISMVQAQSPFAFKTLARHVPLACVGAALYWYTPLRNFTLAEVAKFYGTWAIGGFALEVLCKWEMRAKRLKAALIMPALGIATAFAVRKVF